MYSAQRDAHVEKRKNLLAQGEEVEEEPELTSAQKRFYIESIFTGIIDGIVAYFSRSCHSGLITFVFSLFRMFDYFAIWIPSNTMKFNISMNNFIESSNVVFAYCDVSHFQHEIEEYTEYENWEQYVSLSGRIGGVMIADFWTYYDCVKQGKGGRNGFMVGKCSGSITSLMIDTLF